MLEDRLKEAVEDADRERALKDVAVAMAKDKDKIFQDVERRAQEVERARALAEQSLTEIGEKLGGMELKLAKAESINLAQGNEVAELKATLEVAEDKRYNTGFADAENSVKPIVYQSQRHGFGEGQVAALQAMGVTEDSPQGTPIKYLTPSLLPLLLRTL